MQQRHKPLYVLTWILPMHPWDTPCLGVGVIIPTHRHLGSLIWNLLPLAKVLGEQAAGVGRLHAAGLRPGDVDCLHLHKFQSPALKAFGMAVMGDEGWVEKDMCKESHMYAPGPFSSNLPSC